MKKNKIKWKNEKRKLKDLSVWDENPRQADKKQEEDLSKSLEKFGLADPIIINTDNQIIGGHFRRHILEKHKEKEVDVRVPDRKLTKKEMMELNLRLNKNTGSWNIDQLLNIDEDLLMDVGFEEDELKMMSGLGGIEDMEIDFDRFMVITINPPESPKLKEKVMIEFDKIEDYKKIKKAVEDNKIGSNDILSLL